MDWLPPLLLFVAVSTATPGPNNLLLAASGMHFGMRRTLPHVLGIHVGVYSLVALCALGLGQLMLSLPGAYLGMKLFATGYLLFLAWQITGMGIDSEVATQRPMRMWEAGLFQASNPKAWMMAVTGLHLGLAIDGTISSAALALCTLFATLGAAFNLLWVALGSALHKQMTDPVRRRAVNALFAIFALLTIVLFWVYDGTSLAPSAVCV